MLRYSLHAMILSHSFVPRKKKKTWTNLLGRLGFNFHTRDKLQQRTSASSRPFAINAPRISLSSSTNQFGYSQSQRQARRKVEVEVRDQNRTLHCGISSSNEALKTCSSAWNAAVPAQKKRKKRKKKRAFPLPSSSSSDL